MIGNYIIEDYIRQIKVNGLYFKYSFLSHPSITLNLMVSIQLWLLQGDGSLNWMFADSPTKIKPTVAEWDTEWNF